MIAMRGGRGTSVASIAGACIFAGATVLACESLTGLDANYVEVDCVADCGTPRDDGAGGGGGGGGVSKSDAKAPVDANLGPCTPLGASPQPDAGSGGADAGMTCPAPGSSACTPANVAGFTPIWRQPTGAHQGACTSTQLTDYFAQCQASAATTTTCSNWRSSNAACDACLETRESAPQYGPIVILDNGTVQINVPGCVALLEPCNVACATAYQAAFMCEAAACEPGCPATSSASWFMSYQACATTADGCGCEKYTAASACVSSLVGPLHPASACLSGNNFQEYYAEVAPLFCGD